MREVRRVQKYRMRRGINKLVSLESMKEIWREERERGEFVDDADWALSGQIGCMEPHGGTWCRNALSSWIDRFADARCLVI